MESVWNTVATVRFRTVIAHEWTKDHGTSCLRAYSELARELRYQPARG